MEGKEKAHVRKGLTQPEKLPLSKVSIKVWNEMKGL